MNNTEETSQFEFRTSKNTPTTNINRSNISNFLYSFFQEKYSNYIHQRRNDLKFFISNKINSKITCDEYLNSEEQIKKLTPMPYIPKSKIINFNQEKEFNEFKGNIKMMRRYEYAQKIDQSKLLLKYSTKNIPNIILIQKVIRGFLVRKIMEEVKLLKETLTRFSLSVIFCIKRKCYYIIKNYLKSVIKEQKKEIKIDTKKAEESITKNTTNKVDEEKNKEIIINNDINTSNIMNDDNNKKQQQIINKNNFDNLIIDNEIVNVEIKSKIPTNINENNNIIENDPNNIIINEENDDGIILNDYYIDFNLGEINNKKENDNNKFNINENNLLNKNNKKISQQFEAKVCNIEKKSLLILLKHFIVFNIKTYVFSLFKNNFFSDDELNKTIEDNYFEVKEERIKLVNETFNIAINQIK